MSRAASPTRGGGGAAQPRGPPVPNPFAAVLRELAETHVQASLTCCNACAPLFGRCLGVLTRVANAQAVDFRAFLTLEPRHPQLCASSNLIWSSLQPYASAAAALVAKLRMEGHMEYLAEPKHLSSKLTRPGSGNNASSQRNSAQSNSSSGKVRGVPSRNVSGASSGSATSGKIGVPMLSLGGLQPPPPRGHQRTGSQARALPGRVDDDDLDGFADWAATHTSSMPPEGDEYGVHSGDYGVNDYRARGGNPGWASAQQRTASPTPPHLRRAHSPPMLPPHATWERSLSSNSLAGGASLRMGSPTRMGSPSRGRLPPPVDPAARAASPMRPPHAQAAPLEPQLQSLIAVLQSPHVATTSRSMAQTSARIPSDYYARLDEVASSRRLNRSQTFG